MLGLGHVASDSPLTVPGFVGIQYLGVLVVVGGVAGGPVYTIYRYGVLEVDLLMTPPGLYRLIRGCAPTRTPP